jgi:hypothetical protein
MAIAESNQLRCVNVLRRSFQVFREVAPQFEDEDGDEYENDAGSPTPLPLQRIL